jgi:hypothetical protein
VENKQPTKKGKNNMAEATDNVTTYQCAKCHRTFGSGPALRMHEVRSHGKGWDTSGNFRGKGTPRTRKSGAVIAKTFDNHWREVRARRLANLNRNGGRPWTPEQHAKYRRTMKAKAKLRYVYPAPASAGEDKAQNVRKVNHCPYCGENILRHLTSGGWS